MNITADAVKQLRERTGAGMMECKKALVETKGDLDAAAELMRKQGLAKADKKATRVAAEGVVVSRSPPTAARPRWSRSTARPTSSRAEQDFRGFAQASPPGALAAGRRPRGAAGGRSSTSGETRRGAPPRAGREDRREHQRAPLRRAELARTTSAPTCTARASARWSRSRAATPRSRTIWRCTWPRATRAISATAQVPAEVVAKEREILTEQAQSEGKPPEIVAKMVEGRLRKSLGEITLARPAVREGSRRHHREAAEGRQGAKWLAFERFEVGAGIEKKQDDFVAEVMAQVQGRRKPAVKH